jgi:hypothetical protein
MDEKQNKKTKVEKDECDLAGRRKKKRLWIEQKLDCVFVFFVFPFCFIFMFIHLSG